MSQTKLDQFFKVRNRRDKKASSLKTITKKTSPTNNNQCARTDISDVQIVYDATEKSNCDIICVTPKKKQIKVISPKKFLNNEDESNNCQLSPGGSKSESEKIIHTPSKKKYTPIKKSDLSPKSYSPYRLVMEKEDTLKSAVENLNNAREGIIPFNNFNLERIYSTNKFCLEHSNIDTRTDIRYDINDVVRPNDFTAVHLFTIIVNTFANPINCGYFTKDELEFIFSMLKLSSNAQKLLARMIKRKRSWYRVQKIIYQEISDNLLPIFKELEAQEICTMDITTEEISSLIELLHVNEIRDICKDLKIDCKGKKGSMITKLLSLYKKTSTFFSGAMSPSAAVSSKIYSTLGPCVSFRQKTIDIIDRIVTLLLPCQDPQSSLSDIFFLLMKVQKREIIFPHIALEPFPLFQNKEHLISYVEGKNALSEVLNSIERKDWDTVEYYGNIAYNTLPTLLQEEFIKYGKSKLPVYVKTFAPGYIWCKVLSKTIDAFKKSREKIERAVCMLKLLIRQELYMQHRKGQWYAEIALIEMHHKKDCHASAYITIEALTSETLNEIDRIELVDRARKLLGRKTGITNEVKTSIQNVVNTFVNAIPDTLAPAYNTIEASLMPGNISGSKSTWHIDTRAGNMCYGSVEQLAFHHYSKDGFSDGLHCEGALPVTLFSVLFWEELYSALVPGVFVSTHQDAPLDLFTGEFYENRRGRIDMKLQQIRSLSINDLAEFIGNRYILYQRYQSVMQSSLFKDDQHIKGLIQCLGCEPTIKICEKLLTNFKLWRSGFPDLIVWNQCTKTCKIVEVKGPNDTLSTKQILWLRHLKEIGLEVEVCLVNEIGKAKKRKNMK